jgi:hypothetical protein
LTNFAIMTLFVRCPDLHPDKFLHWIYLGKIHPQTIYMKYSDNKIKVYVFQTKSLTILQCRRCDPVGDKVTWPRITLQTRHWFLLRSCPGIIPWASKVTEINVLFVMLQTLHWLYIRYMPRQERNKNTFIYFNVTNNALIYVTILTRVFMPGHAWARS